VIGRGGLGQGPKALTTGHHSSKSVDVVRVAAVLGCTPATIEPVIVPCRVIDVDIEPLCSEEGKEGVGVSDKADTHLLHEVASTWTIHSPIESEGTATTPAPVEPDQEPAALLFCVRGDSKGLALSGIRALYIGWYLAE